MPLIIKIKIKIITISLRVKDKQFLKIIIKYGKKLKV